MSDLPILEIIPEVKNRLRQHNTLILQAPPGAGKSTILPLHLMDEPWLAGKKIVMLEPRRLAARAVSMRMASELQESAGETVGYRVRFDNKVSKATKIEVVTEGILTRMLQTDNALEPVGLVIFDEFHERSLHADLALALTRETQQVLREDLRILVMSATLDGEKISSLLGNAPILTSQGRQHPVEITYYPPEKDIPLPLAVAKGIRKAYSSYQGDILAFLPGAGEIHRTQEILKAELGNLSVYPLYGDMSQEKQQEALTPDPSGGRKVVLATSIAETSLTIEGIKVVVDGGYSRGPRFDPRTGLTRLDTYRVTKDAADQRAGRAGRLGPGVCIRLWSEGTQQHLVPARTPEILEADLAPLMLELAQWGVKDPSSLTWLTPPPSGPVNQARELLQQLGALEDGAITDRGREMLRLPTHPRMAHLLLEGKKEGLAALASDIAALLEERDPLEREAGVNIATRVGILRKYRRKEFVKAERNVLDRIERLAASWRRIMGISIDNSPVSAEKAGLLLAAAYPERIARQRKQDHRYRLANGRIVRLQEHDPLITEEWIAIAHMDAGSSEGKIFLAAPVDPDDLLHLASEKETLMWDTSKGTLVAQREKRIGDIILASRPLENIPEEKRLSILCDAVRQEGATLFSWTEETGQWQARVMSLRQWRPDEAWPDVTTSRLISTPETWLAPYLSNVRKRDDFLKLDMSSILSGLLPWDLAQKLDTLAPAKFKVPSGSVIRLEYREDGSAPVLAVRLQEVFGLSDTPAVNEGRNNILMHLLSPAYRPVQVTQDLKSFWNNTYQEVRKELRIRYPKHHWPEDPWTAEAVRGVKRKNP